MQRTLGTPMMLGTEHLGFVVRIATVVVPVAVYFLILGLLNSRRHPQLLTGRRDFALMIAALSPLFALPLVLCVGASWIMVAAAVALAVVALLLAPRGAAWVIYNIPPEQARQAVSASLRSLGLDGRPVKDGLYVPAEGATVRIDGFSLLRNVSVRLVGGGRQFARRFELALSQTLAGAPAETTPMAMGLLLVATGLLVAPLALVAHRVPEIVRIITDLLP